MNPLSKSLSGTVALSFFLTGCCFRDVCDWDDIPNPTPPSPAAGVASLELHPAEVSTAPGSSFFLHLLALDQLGEKISLSPELLAWSHDAQEIVSDAVEISPLPDGAVVRLPPHGNLNAFRVKVASQDLKVGEAKISVSANAQNDWIKLPHTWGQPSEVVLLDAEADTCLQDFRVNLAGDADLGLNLTGDCGKPAEVAVFSVDHGMLFEPGNGIVSAGVPPWTPGKDVLERGKLPPIRAVPVHLRIRVNAADTADAEADARKEVLDMASELFLRARAGIAFELDEPNNVGSVDVGVGTGTFDPASCQDPTALASLGVDLSTKGLFVVYAQSIKDGSGDSWKGWACPRMQNQKAGVVVISYLTKSPTTATHELGHAFGLNAPLPKHGHTGKSLEIFGFDYTNVMWIGEDMDKAKARKHFSLGQGFRMNLDRHSWLVHQFDLGNSKTCQCEPYEATVCPYLFLDVVDLGLPTPAYYEPICLSDPWEISP